MFLNYLKTAYRSLWRKKSFTLLNILGLATGIAAALLIFSVIRQELSYDNYHQKKDRIYRVTTTSLKRSNGEVTDRKAAVPWSLPDAFRRDYPQLEEVGVVWGLGKGQIYVPQASGPEKRFIEQEGLVWIEPQMFNILDFRWLQGGPAGLAAPNHVVLSRSRAVAYFGSPENALGKTIQLFSFRIPLKVTGVFEDTPGNTDFPLRIAASYITLQNGAGRPPGSPDNFVNINLNSTCFVVLGKNQQPAVFESRLKDFVKRYYREDERGTDHVSVLGLQPLAQMHLDERYNLHFTTRLEKKELWAMGLVGCFLLLVACVNFINLATAQSAGRAREIGVRKVLGSNRAQLRRQFLYETAMLTFFSLCIGVLIAAVCAPWLGRIIGRELSFVHPSLPLVLLLTGLLVTFLAGFYPAVVISGFNPLAALKNSISLRATGGVSIRRALVVFQFVIAQLLVICTLVVLQQMKFFREKPMGFEKESVVLINLPSDSAMAVRYQHLKTRLSALPGVAAASLCMEGPSATWTWQASFKLDDRGEYEPYIVGRQFADTGFYNTFRLQFAAGRKPLPTDTTEEVVVNEMLVGKLGLASTQEVLGRRVSFGDGMTGRVVGVVKNYNNGSLRDEIMPMIISTDKRNFEHMALRLKPAEMSAVLPQVEKVFAEVYPNYIYDLTFMDQRIENYYNSEALISLLFRIFAALAVFISCLGLYGLVSFMAVQKTKEVGIRKVLGASVQSIVLLFSREFTVLIGLAFLVAAPLAYYLMQQWLEGFRQHVSIGWPVFALAILFSVVIGWCAVGYKAISAALVNPVKSLKAD
jgi:predicted permease